MTIFHYIFKTFAGNRGLEPWEIARPYPSQHTSKVTLSHKGAHDSEPWRTNYFNTFYGKGVNSVSCIHISLNIYILGKILFLRCFFDSCCLLVRLLLLFQPAKLHYPSQINKINMTEGGGVKRVLTSPGPRPATMSQYTRVHDRLGLQLGPGIEREIPARREYNILTGKKTCKDVLIKF